MVIAQITYSSKHSVLRSAESPFVCPPYVLTRTLFCEPEAYTKLQAVGFFTVKHPSPEEFTCFRYWVKEQMRDEY
jgi:hypothetical protein